MYTVGFTLAKIAERLGCSINTVWRDLQESEALCNEIAAMAVAELRATELQQLYAAREEAWSAWIRSQEDAEEEIIRETDEGIETTRKRKGQVGDSRFIAQIIAISARISQLLGLDKTPQEQTTDKTNATSQTCRRVVHRREEAGQYADGAILVGLDVGADPETAMDEDDNSATSQEKEKARHRITVKDC